MNTDKKHLEHGWAYEDEIYHFEHFSQNEAKAKSDTANNMHIVEVIDWACANGDRGTKKVHYNKYFTFDFKDACALATKMYAYFQETSGEIVAIRPVTDDEFDGYMYAFDHFIKQKHEAIPDAEGNAMDD